MLENLGTVAVIAAILYFLRDVIFTLLGKTAKKQYEQAEKEDQKLAEKQKEKEDKVKEFEDQAEKLIEELEKVTADKDWHKGKK